jgi:hypothetical protein
MKLKSFGCSFIFGSELSDNQAAADLGLPIPQESQLTWPAHLARHLGYTYECYARPGSGNLQIAERVLSHAVNADPSLFVIGWSWSDRFDYTNSNIDNRPLPSKWTNWRTIMPIDNTTLAKNYYRELHTEYRDKLTTLMSIKLVIDTLEQKNIPFVMTYMDDLIFDQTWHVTPAVVDLQEYVRPYMTTFDNLNFLTWSKQRGHHITQSGHPLDDAHQAAGDYMIKVFDKKNTVADCHRV